MDRTETAAPAPSGPLDAFLAGLKGDAAAVWDEAKAGVKAEADNAIALATTALRHVAGEAPGEVDSAMASGIQLVVNNTPPQYREPVQMFVTTIAAGANPQIDDATKSAVTSGLTWALAWLSGVQHSIDAHLS